MSQKEQNDSKQKSKARLLLDKLDEIEEVSNKRRYSFLSLFTTLLVAIISGIIASLTIYTGSPKKVSSSYEVFKESVINSLKAESISLNNIELLYQGATLKQKDDPELILNLRKDLVRIHLEITKGDNLAEDDKKVILAWTKNIREIISEIDKESPYYGLPATERNLVEEINLLNQHQNSQLKSKIDQLAVLIGARKEELEKVQSQARWSLVLAIAGIAGTIVSIVISLTQLFRKRITSMPEIQFKNLSFE